jgi:hypothetical protein
MVARASDSFPFLLSGFTMARNAAKFAFPIAESVASILPIVGEFVIALDPGDPDDDTVARLAALPQEKLHIIPRKWDDALFKGGKILAHETNVALDACKGRWCFYLQADELVHEQDWAVIVEACERYADDPRVEGLLFKYRHFWGDYNHAFQDFHGWYRKEIRVVKNGLGIRSIISAQSFRHSDDRKLKVVEIPAYIHHYGWVRPPSVMAGKKREHDVLHKGKKQANAIHDALKPAFDYGPLGRIQTYNGTHPAVLQDWMAQMNWAHELNQGKAPIPDDRPKFKHEKGKYIWLTRLERLLGRGISDYSNWEIAKGVKW